MLWVSNAWNIGNMHFVLSLSQERYRRKYGYWQLKGKG